MKILSNTSLTYLLNKIKNNFFQKSESIEVDTLNIDTQAIENSNNLITSGGVYNNLSTKQNVIDSTHKLDYSLLDNTPTIPVKTSDLQNDSGFITNTVNNLVNYYLKSETYTKTEVNNLISAISTMSLQVVQVLPTEDIQTNIIYLVPRQTTETNNVYDEYIYVSNAWEKIGSTDVDLTGYATETWVNIQISSFLTQSQIEGLISTALTNYYTKSEVNTELAKKQNIMQRTGEELEDITGLVLGNIYQCTSDNSVQSADVIIDGVRYGDFIAGYFYQYVSDSEGEYLFAQKDIQPQLKSFKINGNELIDNGAVNITTGSASGYSQGLAYNTSTHLLSLFDTTDPQVSTLRYEQYARQIPILVKNLDTAVKAAMTDGIGATWTDAEKNGCYDRITIRKTSLDQVLVPNANYDLGSTAQASVTLTLPTPTVTDNYSCNEIYVAFKSGSTATTLSIVGTYEGDTSYLPNTDSICELSFKYICGTWILATKETAISSI